MVKICFDRLVNQADILKASRAAIIENPANRPAGSRENSREYEVRQDKSGKDGLMTSVMPSPEELALEIRRLWKPGRTLKIKFLDGSKELQQRVAEFAKEWERYAHLHLVFVDSEDAEIRISFKADPGSWSFLGTDALTIPPNQPTMNLGWLTASTPDSEVQRVVLHEFGHALGCIHEHQHPEAAIPWDKKAVYQEYSGPPNFWSKEVIDHNIFEKYARDWTQFSAFDRNSIMLYPIPAELTNGGFEVGWNQKLSQTDQAFIAQSYPLWDHPIEELTVADSPLEAEIGRKGEDDRYRFLVLEKGEFVIETGGQTDTVIALFDTSSHLKPIAEDDDSGEGLNARLKMKLDPGVYYLRVHHYLPNCTGKYSIQVKGS